MMSTKSMKSVLFGARVLKITLLMKRMDILVRWVLPQLSVFRFPNISKFCL